MIRTFSIYRLAGCLCAAVALVGCSRNAEDDRNGALSLAGAEKRISEMSAGDIVVVVNGEKVTKADFDALLRVRAAIFQLQNKIDLEDTEADAVKFFETTAMPMIVPELIHHKLFEQYAKEKGIRPPPAAVASARERFAKSISRRTNEIERLSRRIGGLAGDVFARIPYVDAQDAMLRQSVTTNDLDSVSEADIARIQARIDAWDKTADRNNEESRKRLMEARAEIDAGGDFGEVAAKYSQVSPEHGKAWATYQLGELPKDEDLYKWLSKAKVGEISPPLDLEDGLAIVKLVEMGKGEAPAGVERPDTYTLVKCTAYAYQYVQHLERPALIREILKMKRSEAQKTLGTMLVGRAVLEYPNGTNFFGVAEAPQER